MEVKDIKDWFIKDVDVHNRPKKLIFKVYKLIDFFESKNSEIETLKQDVEEQKESSDILLEACKSANDKIKEENEKLRGEKETLNEMLISTNNTFNRLATEHLELEKKNKSLKEEKEKLIMRLR